MSQSVCLYSELEPYSGSISHNPSDLPRLIRHLIYACLFYDVVVVHRRNVLEHPAHVTAKDDVGKIFILDLASCVLYEKNSANSPVKLGQQQTNLLSILVIAGKLGLIVDAHLKQWLIEVDAFKEKKLKWKSQAELNRKYDDKFFELRNRIDGLKRYINKKLKQLGLIINNEKGKWYLQTENSNQDFIIK